MGSSDKPAGGYDKKSMAVTSPNSSAARLQQVDVIGHDIGSMVAFSFAANHAEQVAKLDADVTHPSSAYLSLSSFQHYARSETDSTRTSYLWWFAFHQVKGLPEQLLEGRAGIEQDGSFDTC